MTRDYEDDLGYESLGEDHIKGVPTDPVDKVEQQTRGRDYEAMSGRVRTGHDGELKLDRVSLDGGAHAGGAGSGADWEGNMSTRKSQTAMDGTGIQHDTRGSVAYTGRTDGVDEKLHREMQESGLRLGINSVNTTLVGFVMGSTAYIRNKERWRCTPQWFKDQTNAQNRKKRANRKWEKVRDDSLQRHATGIFKGFQDERREADPYYDFGDPSEIERDAGIDRRSAVQMATKWRMETDEKNLDAFVVKYAAMLECIKPDSIRARFKRDPQHKDLAEYVFVQDALACGVEMPGGFDRDTLLGRFGDELAIHMDTPVTERERREFIINGAHDYYKKGNLFPPYVYSSIEDMLDEVIAILEASGFDLSEPEEEIDWARV